MENKKESIYSVASKTLFKIENQLDTPSGRALLANLRNSIGKDMTKTIEVWPLLFENMPEEYLGKTGKLTAQEKAVLTSLQLYALHQQGSLESVNERQDGRKNIGSSLKFLRTKENTVSTDRRFNAMITSASFEELTHHLRQMINLLKSRTDETVNYAKLAEDLYWFERGHIETTRLKWARSYYSFNKKGEEENEQQ